MDETKGSEEYPEWQPEEITQMEYDTLRALASELIHSRRNPGSHQTTSLVHEAYLRLYKGKDQAYRNRSHFYAVASRAMRYILVDQFRQDRSDKRGGRRRFKPLNDAYITPVENDIDLEALNSALEKLSHIDEMKGRIVELRFFGGLSVEETGEVTNLSTATVKRYWALAKAWLHREMVKTGY